MPLDGGAVLTLATGVGTAYGVALDEARVYWSAATSIKSLPNVGGDSAVTHAKGLAGAFDVAVDSTAIYWVDWAGGKVMKVAK